MSEYIKRELAASSIAFETDMSLEQAREILGNVPSIDIVHCKDCKYWNDWQAHTYCGRFDEYGFMPSDGYCSYGERREQENEITERSNYTL